jgi:hypothetical protein
MTRPEAAKAVKQHFGIDVSPRTMERWPVRVRRLNGKAHPETEDVFRHAQAMIDAAPLVCGESRPATGTSERRLTQ